MEVIGRNHDFQRRPGKIARRSAVAFSATVPFGRARVAENTLPRLVPNRADAEEIVQQNDDVTVEQSRPVRRPPAFCPVGLPVCHQYHQTVDRRLGPLAIVASSRGVVDKFASRRNQQRHADGAAGSGISTNASRSSRTEHRGVVRGGIVPVQANGGRDCLGNPAVGRYGVQDPVTNSAGAARVYRAGDAGGRNVPMNYPSVGIPTVWSRLRVTGPRGTARSRNCNRTGLHHSEAREDDYLWRRSSLHAYLTSLALRPSGAARRRYRRSG